MTEEHAIDREQFLKDTKLGDFCDIFTKRDITIEELLEFERSDLKLFAKELGLDALSQNRLVKAIIKLKPSGDVNVSAISVMQQTKQKARGPIVHPCNRNGCYCKAYVIATSKWSIGKCKSCAHPQKEHSEISITADISYEKKDVAAAPKQSNTIDNATAATTVTVTDNIYNVNLDESDWMNWGCDDLLLWFRQKHRFPQSLKLNSIEHQMRNNSISGNKISQLTHSRMLSFGFTKYDHRKKLLDDVKTLLQKYPQLQSQQKSHSNDNKQQKPKQKTKQKSQQTQQKNQWIIKYAKVKTAMDEQQNKFKEYQITQVKKTSKLQKENETLRNERDQTQQKNRKQQTQINKLQQKFIDTKQRLDHLVAKNKELQRKVPNAQGNKAEKQLTNQMAKEAENLQQQLNDTNNENIALKQQNETLWNENNQYKKNMGTIEHKLNESLKAKIRQQKTILELQNLLSDKSEQEEKSENAAKCLSKIVTDLNNEIESFKQNYNEKKLNDIFEKSPKELIQNDSETNKTIKKYHKNTESVIESSKSFIKFVNNMQLFIDKISIPKVNEYKTWNLQQIMAWIIRLENGKYIKYSEILREGFVKCEILTGNLLPELTRNDLSSPPFSINQFVTRRNLENHFKSLAGSNIIPSVNDNISPANNTNNHNNEGSQTQFEYFDR